MQTINIIRSILMTTGQWASIYEEEAIFGDNRTPESILDETYNCMAYAFGIKRWLIPLMDSMDVRRMVIAQKAKEGVTFDTTAGEEEIETAFDGLDRDYYNDLVDHVMAYTDSMDEAFNAANEMYYENNLAFDIANKIVIDNLLRAFDDLRVIEQPDDAQEDEYCIAYKGGFGDFHFAKIEDGIITHKMGGRAIQTVSSLEEAFENEECYRGKTVFFAKKKSA